MFSKKSVNSDILNNIYKIGIMILTPIREFGDRDYLVIDVYDLSVTAFTIPKKEEYVWEGRGKNKRKILKFSPEIKFFLKTEREENVSLSECLLPSHNVLASKAIFRDDLSERERKKGEDGKEIEYFSKIVFDLIVFTKKSLIKTTQTYEEYQQDLAKLRAEHKEEIEQLRRSQQERVETIIEPYRRNEKRLRDEIEKLNQKISELTMKIPEIQNKKLLDFILKSNEIKRVLNE